MGGVNLAMWYRSSAASVGAKSQGDRRSIAIMATRSHQSIVLWPNQLPLECGVIRAYDRSLRGSTSGSSCGRLSVQVSRSIESLNFK